jgi:hypothetical protein
MPRRTLLSTAQRDVFERLPIEPDELIKYYHLTAEELVIIKKRRRDSNRLGFAVQLCLCRYPGRILRPGEQLPQELLIFIAEQTNTQAEDFADYAHRDQTRRAHIAELISTFQFWTFIVQHFRKILQWLVPIAVEIPKSMFLVGAVFNELRHRRILHGVTTEKRKNRTLGDWGGGGDRQKHWKESSNCRGRCVSLYNDIFTC